MKNIGIITLPGYYNYGNKLQKYALYSYLCNMGVNVTIIRLESDMSLKSRLKRLLSPFYHSLKPAKYDQPYILFKKRELVFKEFSRQFLNETDFIISENNMKDLDVNSFDLFISGSDQVWNPNYNHYCSIYFVDFAPEEKRASYAASFGLDKLELSSKELYKDWLSQMTNISVREEEGADIVEKLIGKRPLVHVDPTLLLTRKEWTNLARESKLKPSNPYLLTYFLGEVSMEDKKKMEDLAKRNKLKIVHLNSHDYPDLYIEGPAEFVDFFKDASFICTDSFHGNVFSILFEKPFAVYKRPGKDMSSRINTLLGMFGLEDRWAHRLNFEEDIFEMDYSHKDEVLKRERERSKDYLENIINR